MVLTRVSLVIPLGMINVMQGAAQRFALCPFGVLVGGRGFALRAEKP